MPKSNSPTKKKLLGVASEFMNSPVAGGIILILASAAAIIVANSPLHGGYESLINYKAGGLSTEHWVNDGLMAIFFLFVGLEIKREIISGQLATWNQRVLPGFAALGGIAVPALIYAYFNMGNSDSLRGWAIPAATDIAFALGVLALLGKRVPASLKIFLSALAILDDMGAIAIIAVFYTSQISFVMLGGVMVTAAVMFIMNKTGVKRLIPYAIAGCLMWFFMLQSGVHATVAGILLAFFIPLRTGKTADSPLERLEHSLEPWVVFLILPVFGFVNSGVSLTGLTTDELLSPIPVGIATGLFIGKQAGVFCLSLLAINLGLAKMPEKSSWLQIYGVSVLCGIGFTMSLFIGNLAFAESPLLIAEVKIGVLAGSIISAIMGAIILAFARQR